MSNQTATFCRTALPAVQWSERIRREVSPVFSARNADADVPVVYNRYHSACAFRERDQATFHDNALAPSNAGA